MRRVVLFAALAASSLFALPAIATAGDDPPVSDPPAAVTLPGPGPVVDNDTAAAFAKIVVFRNAARFLDQDRRRVRVLEVAANCLQHPALATRFGCVFTLRAAVIQRSHGWDWGHASSKRGGHHPPRPRVRVRNFGCLGALTINGGPAVTPTAQIRFVECARIPKEDTTVVAPV